MSIDVYDCEGHSDGHLGKNLRADKKNQFI